MNVFDIKKNNILYKIQTSGIINGICNKLYKNNVFYFKFYEIIIFFVCIIYLICRQRHH